MHFITNKTLLIILYIKSCYNDVMFSCMLIFNFHKRVIVVNSVGTCLSRNVFEAVQ